jgi:hypothetical protein
MTDQTPPEPPPVPEPRPEPDPSAPSTGRPAGRLVRLGCIVLGVLGALGVALGATTASDPEGGRCTQARSVLEDEDVVEDGGDVGCDEAVEQATALAAADEDVDEIATESTIRTFGLIVAGIGVLQLVGAVLTLRTRTKPARLVALVGAGLGIVFSPLGLLGIPILGFVVYALSFSGDARTVFGDPSGLRAFRPRT